MGTKALVTEVIEAGAELAEALDKSLPVTVSFWLDAEHEHDWVLYIALARPAEEVAEIKHAEISRIVNELDNPNINAHSFRLISAADSLAIAAKAASHHRVPRRVDLKFEGSLYCRSKFMAPAYVYPELVKTS